MTRWEYRPNARPRTRPSARPRRTPPRTKERKARIHPLLGAIWSTFSPITETMDLANVLYECLPKKFKRAEYKARGRQPDPLQKLYLVYQNINDLDVACAVTGYMKEKVEDMIAAAGSGKIKELNQLQQKPIGYEAGPALGGGYSDWNIGPVILR